MNAPTAAPPLFATRDRQKLSAALHLVHRALALSASCPEPFDAAVLLYTGDEQGQPTFHTLLPETTLESPWLDGERVRELLPGAPERDWPWPRPAATGATTSAAVLERVCLVVREWLSGSWMRSAPVVVHLTDNTGWTDEVPRLVRSLRCLQSGGHTVLLHAVYSSDASPDVTGLRLASSRLEKDRTACFVNTYPADQIIALLSRPQSRLYRDASPAPSWRFDSRSFSLAKDGNRPEENEDASAVSQAGWSAAIADGAGSGIFSPLWARLLCRNAVENPAFLADEASLVGTIDSCRTQWLQAIQPERLSYTKQRKIRQTGTGTTLLTLTLQPMLATRRDEPVFMWWARSVGDSCLFWIRQNRLHASFPGVTTLDFGLDSPLLQTLEHGPVVTPLQAGGLGKPGDFFLLATDALAQILMQSHQAGESLWPDFWNKSDQDRYAFWESRIRTWRARNEMVNDDCTWVVLRIHPV